MSGKKLGMGTVRWTVDNADAKTLELGNIHLSRSKAQPLRFDRFKTRNTVWEKSKVVPGGTVTRP